MGFFGKVKERAKEALEDYEKNRSYDRAANEIIKKKAKAAYYQAKEKEAIKYEQQKAAYEREEKIKSLKHRDTNFKKAFSGFDSPGKSVLPPDLFSSKRSKQKSVFDMKI
jgi:hypothetical protein